MELRILIIIFTLSNSLTMFSHRGFLCRTLLCMFLCLSAYEFCSTNVRPNLPDYDACESSGKNWNLGFSDHVVSGTSLGCASPPIDNSFRNVCPDTHSFCTSSTLGDSGSQCNGLFYVGLAQGCGNESPFGNDAASALSFVKVVEVADSEFIHIKYMEVLMLFPNTVTHVGIIYFSNLDTDMHNMSPEVSNLQENCKLVILTNDTTSPQVEIPCKDAVHICFEHLMHSFVGIKDKTELVSSGSVRAEYVVGNMELPPNVKVTETTDVDELVYGNWVSQGTTNAISVLEYNEVLFPMVQVGNYVSRWITVKNPSDHPVTVQLILNREEVIDECRGPDDILHKFSSGNLVTDEEGISPAKYGFSLPESAVTEAYVHPYGYANLGPITFYPSKRCGWNGSAMIKNNLSGVEWIPLRGIGGLISLALLERSKHVESVNFDLKMHNLLRFSLPFSLFNMKDPISACSKPLMKEIYAKNTGDLPLEVKTMRISGRECGLDGFKIHDCNGFALDPGESIKFRISYQTDFSAARVHRNLELAWASGIFLIPVKASVPYDVVCNCKKFMFWMLVRKWLVIFILAAFLIFTLSCDFSCKNGNNSIDTPMKHAGETPQRPCNQTNMSGSVGNGITSTMPYDPSETPDQEVSQKEEKSPTTAVNSSDVVKPSQQGELIVKTGKEKGRRRKKKSVGAKSTAVSEASSSRSGNSTPSSPSSPLTAASTKSNSPTSQKTAQHLKKFQTSASAAKTNILKDRVPKKYCNNNVSSPKVSYSPSTSDVSIPFKMFPAASPMLGGGPSPSSFVPTSNVNLSCRAPGSKLEKKKTVLAPKKAGVAEEYTYDIWGGHLSGLHLLAPKDVTCMKSSPAEKNFNSFFVGDPLAIIK